MFVSGTGFGHCLSFFVFFQAEDGIRDLVRSRGLGDVYKRQVVHIAVLCDRRIQARGGDWGGRLSVAYARHG